MVIMGNLQVRVLQCNLINKTMSNMTKDPQQCVSSYFGCAHINTAFLLGKKAQSSMDTRINSKMAFTSYLQYTFYNHGWFAVC